MADETREVSVKLSVDVGPEGDRAIKSLEESAKRAGAALGKSAGAAAGPGARPSPIASTPPGGGPGPMGTPFGPAKPSRPVSEILAESKATTSLVESAKKMADAARPPAGLRPPPGTYGFADTPPAARTAEAVSAAGPAAGPRGTRDNVFARMVKSAVRNEVTETAKEITPMGLTDERVKAIRNLQMGGLMHRVGTVQAYGQGMSELGIPGGAALQRFAGPVALAGAAGSAALQTARIAQDPYATGTQMGRSFLRDVVPGGSTALSISDTLTGRAAAMERAGVAGQEALTDVRRRGELSSFQGSFNVAQAGRESLAQSFARGSAVAPPSGSRATGEGERAFREESRLYPLRVQAAKAERDALAATKERLAADQEMNKLANRGKDLDVERVKLTKQLTEEESGPKREQILQRIKATEEEIQSTAGARKGMAGTQSEARQREAQARAEVTRNQAAQLGAQAENLEARAASSAAGARSLGMMSPLERNQAAMAVEAAQKYGLDALPPELKQLAMQTAPETIGKQAEKIGAGSEAFGRLQKVAGADFAGDPEKLRQEAADLRRQQAEKEFEADKMIAGAAATAGRDVGKVVVDAINAQFDAMKREIMNNIRIGRNAT